MMQDAESASKRVIQVLNEDNENAADQIIDVDKLIVSADKLADVSAAIVTLWKDEGFKQCFSRSKEYQLIDSAKYYLDKAAQICNPSFLPDNQDILR
jgi:hypothetical protein